MVSSLLLPTLAAGGVDVNVAALFMLSYKAVSTAESCAGVGNWRNGTCWEIEPMQAVVVSALLGVTDFNSRNASALPALRSLTACDKQLRFRLLDSGGSVSKSILALGDLSAGTDLVIGPGRSSVSTTIARMTGAHNIPQISYWSTSPDLDNIARYPRFMRTIPSDLSTASSLCNLWKYELGLSNVAVLFVNDPYGRAYEEAAKAACLTLGLTFVSREFSNSNEDSIREESIRSAAISLSSSGAKAVLVITFPTSLGLIVEAALVTGLLRPGTSFMFADGVTAAELDMVHGEGRAALNGSLQIKACGATDDNPQWARFDDERWATLQPGDFNEHLPADWQLRDNFFRDPLSRGWLPSGGSFAYDAVVAAGLLSCNVTPTGPLSSSFGTRFWESKQALSFEGLSGRVEFDEKGDRSGANVHLFNLVDQGGFSEKYVARLSSGEWVWEGGSRESSGVIYNFGLEKPPFEAPPPPPPLRPPPFEPARYNHEGRCGPGYPGLAGNAIGECDPESDLYCCSPFGYCGRTEEHCKCADCIDYRPCEAACAEGACSTPPFGYSRPCRPSDEPPKATVAVTVDFECGGGTAAAIANLTEELEFMVGRSQLLPLARPMIATVHVMPRDAFTQCAVQAAAATTALAPLPFLRCVSASAGCEAITLGEDATDACEPEIFGIDGDMLRRCVTEAGVRRRMHDAPPAAGLSSTSECAVSVNTSGVRIVPPSALKELVINDVDIRYIGSVAVDCCGGACNVTDWACEAYTHTERVERNCTYTKLVNQPCSSARECNSECCARGFCAVPPPVSSGRTCRDPNAVPGAINLDGPILRLSVFDGPDGRQLRIPCGPRCLSGEWCTENETQVTRCNDGECCGADGYCGGGSSSLDLETGMYKNALGIGRHSAVLAAACHENNGDWRYVECPHADELEHVEHVHVRVSILIPALVAPLACVALMLSVAAMCMRLSRIAALHGTSPSMLLRRRIARSCPICRFRACARALYRAARFCLSYERAAEPHVVWAQLCRRANKEPTLSGPPDIERLPFVEQCLWSSVLERKLWGTAAREAAQLREWLHVTRNTTPFIEACVEKLVLRCGTAACTLHGGACDDDGHRTDHHLAHADLEAGPRMTRTLSTGNLQDVVSQTLSLNFEDLLRFCLNEQGVGGRRLWEEWKAALRALRSEAKLQLESSRHHRDASYLRDSASRHAPRRALGPRVGSSSEAVESEPITVHEFASLLLSPCNSAIDMAIERRSTPTDAGEPLTSYWISSSHNSFLEDDQLTSAVSADMYRRLLLSGTRCLEIDCWDPTAFGRWWGQGPRVTHRMPGGVPLLCGSVAFSEVVAAIAEHAFTSSPLPVLLSLEMHCSAKQQKKIARALIDTLGDLLSRSDRVASTPLRELHRKVLVKMRLDKGGTQTDPLLRSLVTLPSSSIGEPLTPKEVDNGLDDGCRLREKVCRSWKELSGRTTGRSRYQIGDEWRLAGRCVRCWLRGVPLESHSDADVATQTSESPFGSPGSAGWQSAGSWPAEESASELPAARVPRRGVVSVSEDRLEWLLSEQGGWFPLAASQLVRTYPSPTRWWSTNPDPLAAWRAGVQMVALNMQTNDLPVQLHDALFRESGGYALKPAALRAPPGQASTPPKRGLTTPKGRGGSGGDRLSRVQGLEMDQNESSSQLGSSLTVQGKLPWPPPREEVHRTELKVLSLHRLPTRDECRPLHVEPHHAFVSHLSDSPRPPSGSSASVSSPRVAIELYAIGGFHAVGREPQPPPEAQGVTRLVTAVAEGNGLNPSFDETFHCLAAEPHQTILRVVVEDEGRLVAYETAMLCSLRCGYRCLHLRSPSGTQIDSCCLLLHISVATEPNTFGTVDELRSRVQSQRSRISQQSRDIHHLSAELSRLGGMSSSPVLSPAPSCLSARWPLELVLDAGVNGARVGRPSPIALPPSATLTVGRDASSSIALFPLNAQHISRQHAVLHVAADGRSVRLEDVSHKNGCRVQQPGGGGEPVVLQSTAEGVASAQLREGSVLTFGHCGATDRRRDEPAELVEAVARRRARRLNPPVPDEFRYVVRAAGAEGSPPSSPELSRRATRRTIELPRVAPCVRSPCIWQSPLASAMGTSHDSHGLTAAAPKPAGCRGPSGMLSGMWMQRMSAHSEDREDISRDGENNPAPASPPPSLPPSLQASSLLPAAMPSKLRTGPPRANSHAFYAGVGITPASAPQKRRSVHTGSPPPASHHTPARTVAAGRGAGGGRSP